MNNKMGQKIIYSILFFIAVIALPFWAALLINAILIVLLDKKFVPALTLLQVFLSTMLISTMDITGDLANYRYLYENINSPNVVFEFYSEPLVIYLFKFFNYLSFKFTAVIFFISFLINISLYLLFLKKRDIDCLRFLGLILIYPSYMQTQLYIFRQSIAVFIFLLYMYSKLLMPRVGFFFAATISHTTSILYFSILFVRRIFKIENINSNYVKLIIVIAIVFPINVTYISKFLGDFAGFSYALNRKLDFFLNNESITSSLVVYSTVFLPLHFISLYTLFIRRNIKLGRYSFIFFTLYIMALFLREYSLLPTRLSYPIFWLSFIFVPLVFKEQKIYINNFVKSIFLVFSILSLFKFLLINDYGVNNLHFNNHNLLTLNFITYLMEQ